MQNWKHGDTIRSKNTGVEVSFRGFHPTVGTLFSGVVTQRGESEYRRDHYGNNWRISQFEKVQ